MRLAGWGPCSLLLPAPACFGSSHLAENFREEGAPLCAMALPRSSTAIPGGVLQGQGVLTPVAWNPGGCDEPLYTLPCAAATAGPLPQQSREEAAQLERAGEVQEAGKRVAEARSKERVELHFLRQEAATGGRGTDEAVGYEREAVAASGSGSSSKAAD